MSDFLSALRVFIAGVVGFLRSLGLGHTARRRIPQTAAEWIAMYGSLKMLSFSADDLADPPVLDPFIGQSTDQSRTFGSADVMRSDPIFARKSYARIRPSGEIADAYARSSADSEVVPFTPPAWLRTPVFLRFDFDCYDPSPSVSPDDPPERHVPQKIASNELPVREPSRGSHPTPLLYDNARPTEANDSTERWKRHTTYAPLEYPECIVRGERNAPKHLGETTAAASDYGNDRWPELPPLERSIARIAARTGAVRPIETFSRRGLQWNA